MSVPAQPSTDTVAIRRRPGTRVKAPDLPGYEVMEELGRGGMGVVYKARDTALGRVVAIKMILAGAHVSERQLRRFRTEAEAIASLRHPNIVQIHELGEADGLPFVVLEYCGGGGLNRRLREAPLPPREAADLVRVLAGAVRAAHEAKVIHRDLKPANVLLLEDGTPRVSDFGLARRLDEDSQQTRTGEVMGTPSYMAPEQARGEEAGPAADVYALGAILYECLTGRPPFQAASSAETLRQVLWSEPVPPSRQNAAVPADLENVCLKCLEKEAGRRYASAADLGADLGRYLAGEPVVARPVGTLGRLWKAARRRPVVSLLTVGLVVALVAGAGVSLAFAGEAQRQAGEAAAEAANARTAMGEAEREAGRARAALEESERALAAGLLRPLGHYSDGDVNDFELAALKELATLPPHRERVRGYFMEHALSGEGPAGQLGRRLAAALRACTGLSPARRAAAVERAREALRRAGTGPVVRCVAAMVLAEMGAGDGASADVLVTSLTPPPPGIAAEAACRSLWLLARGASPTLAGHVWAGLDELATRRHMDHIAEEVLELRGLLLGRRGGAAAGRAAALLGAPPPRPTPLYFRAAARLARLAGAEAAARAEMGLREALQAALDPAFAQTRKAEGPSSSATVLGAYAELVTAVPGEDGSRAALALIETVIGRLIRDPHGTDDLLALLGPLGARLGPAEARTLGRGLADRMAAWRPWVECSRVAQALDVLEDRLPKADVRRAWRAMALVLASGGANAPEAVELAARRLPAGYAAPLAFRVQAELVRWAPIGLPRPDQMAGARALAGRLTAEDAAEAARRLQGACGDAGFGKAYAARMLVLDVVERLPEGERRRLAGAVCALARGSLRAATDPVQSAAATAVIGRALPMLDAAEARGVAAEVFGRLPAAENTAWDLVAALAFGRVAGHVEAGKARAWADGHAQALIGMARKAGPLGVSPDTARGLAAAAVFMGSARRAEAVEAVFRQVLGRLGPTFPNGFHPAHLEDYQESLGEMAPLLDAGRWGEVSRAVAGWKLERRTRPDAMSCRVPLTRGDLGHLTEADGVELLKHPRCTGGDEAAVLARLGTLRGRGFGSVGEYIAAFGGAALETAPRLEQGPALVWEREPGAVTGTGASMRLRLP